MSGKFFVFSNGQAVFVPGGVVSASGASRVVPRESGFSSLKGREAFLLRPREVKEVLGIPDPQVWLAYLLCILSGLLCVVYGVLNWNRDS
jgi:hypothetical protein